MKKVARYLMVFVALNTFIWLTACESTLTGTEKETVLAFSEPSVDNLIAGLTANDYSVFSRDFDSDMYKRASSNDFTALKEEMEGIFGNYLSRDIDRVTRSQEFYVVDYRAKFEREEQVTVRVAFHASDHSIAALSFESEKYSWSAWE